MLDRRIAPLTKKIDNIDFISPREFQLNSQVKLFWMSDVPNQTSRIDLFFDAGLRQDRNIIASLCSSLLLSGTQEKKSTQIHHEIDALGAYFDIGLSHEGVLISIFALKSNISEAFKLIYTAIQDAVFPEKEIIEVVHEKREKFKINLSKVGFLAQREFQKKIFFNTPYHELTELEDFDDLSREDIIEFHNKHFKKGLSRIAITGALQDFEIQEIKTLCTPNCISKKLSYYTNFDNKSGVYHIDKTNALQSAIRIGRTMFNKTHEDFMDFSILNTVFGDYFGSRLMKNIREDKGFTYGIGSALVETGGSGYFIIGSEVGIHHKEASIQEIHKEMKIIGENPIPEAELSLVKNYLLGQILKLADGPYAMMDLYLSIDAYGLNMDFYNSYINRIHSITSEDIINMANKHLNWDSMTVVTSG